MNIGMAHTSIHSDRNFSRYARRIAEQLGMPEREVALVEGGALLHRMGNDAIRDALLHGIRRGPSILAVADVFEAITRTSDDDEACCSFDTARAYIASGSGTRFDAAVVDAFLSIRPEDLGRIRLVAIDDCRVRVRASA